MRRTAESAFEKLADDVEIDRSQPSPRPKDAATLILVRRDGEHPRILLGKRSGGHVFMPEKYVFPGGRVDPHDGRAHSVSELGELDETRLRALARRRPRALALTAARETFEETGLVVGQKTDMPVNAPPGWEALYALGIAPSLKDFRFIGRAITPPYQPRRFDARFFMGEAEHVLLDDRPPQDGAELHDLQWVTIRQAEALDLAAITRFMVAEVADRLSRTEDWAPPFLRWNRGRHENVPI